ncbi:HAMP domain-containing sensor histidine kinase [Paenibacillus eucommiae]|uniref:histidine kinase n=1 Tax=Paenibacillus eucommiae TaxID=1355755 RepID=A0ABS4J968_9BACL|nr:HAMP domain-containing sensor histidine kinase [Paenibacillus eucommiae]MBP1996345.1 signal transduction histidine kinase [Paenibacillus eucommiae]
MRNSIWTFLKGTKSLRGQMLWAFVLSLIITIAVTSVLGPYLIIAPDLLVQKIFALGSFVFLFILSFFLLTRPIIRYFKAITDGLKLIAEGNLKFRLPLSRQDELGVVAQNINIMAERLQQQLERERKLEESKMELITYVSHDLRTPLTSIIGYLDLLKTQAFQSEQEQTRYIDNAYNKTQQLKKLIDDLFEYTRLTNGDVRLSIQEVEFNSLLEQMLTEFEPVAKEQEISIRKKLNARPILLHVDIEKMVRAIDNLFMNALKFSNRPGEITVQLTAKQKQVTLSIENLGKPISKEQEAQLFERFYKMEPSRHDKHLPSGSGLGLSITKNIVELHNGQIWLEHNEGHYKFYIEIPFSKKKPVH